ncbi:hypothetical protein [Kribbella sp. NPDC050470]|uniref:hypothetical protein n=1 Tax=unclassified Kribbella TaxID=2644121 RepID=UPI00379D2C0D
MCSASHHHQSSIFVLSTIRRSVSVAAVNLFGDGSSLVEVEVGLDAVVVVGVAGGHAAGDAVVVPLGGGVATAVVVTEGSAGAAMAAVPKVRNWRRLMGQHLTLFHG